MWSLTHCVADNGLELLIFLLRLLSYQDYRHVSHNQLLNSKSKNHHIIQ